MVVGLGGSSIRRLGRTDAEFVAQLAERHFARQLLGDRVDDRPYGPEPSQSLGAADGRLTKTDRSGALDGLPHLWAHLGAGVKST